jgi:hypothetical protein
MPILPISGDMRVQFEAIDPATGQPVSGVKVSLAVIYATDARAEEISVGDSGPFMLVPGLAPVAAASSTITRPGAL